MNVIKYAYVFAAAVMFLSAGCAAGETADMAPDTDTSDNAASISTVDAAGILDLVNYPGTTLEVLDQNVGLDARAARNIIAHRDGADAVSPSRDDAYFATIASLDAVPYVGSAAFARLHDYAVAHPAPASEHVEGVTFAGWESESVVWGVNHADVATLNTLIDARAAQNLVAHAPYTSVAQMGPVAYVGTAALNHLLAHAPAWWTAMHATACTSGFSAAVTPHLADLLVMSESDRPLDVVQFAGAGATAPTADSVLALVNAPAGSTAQLRSVDNFYQTLEPSSSTADPNAAAAVQAAVAANLHNVVYVAVFAPPGSPDTAIVNVYLVGQDACGNLVGLHSIAIET